MSRKKKAEGKVVEKTVMGVGFVLESADAHIELFGNEFEDIKKMVELIKKKELVERWK